MASDPVSDVLMDENLMTCILGCLEGSEDKHAASLTCKTWYRAQRRVPQKLHCNSVLFPAIYAEKFLAVTGLHLSKCLLRISDEDLQSVLQTCAGTLTELHLQESTEFASQSMLMRNMIPTNDELTVGLSSIALCAGLKRLYLSAHVPGLSSSCLHAIATGCRELEVLELVQARPARNKTAHLFGDEDVAAFLASCTSLRSLALRDCHCLTDLTLEALSGSQSLQDLSLEGRFGFTNAGIQAWEIGCGNLQNVTLSFKLDTRHPDLAAVDALLEGLASRCRELRTVRVGVRSRRGVSALAACPRLRAVHLLAYSQDDNADLAALAEGLNTRLEELSASYLPIPPAGPHLSAIFNVACHCSNLRSLSLPRFNIPDNTMHALSQMPMLGSLEVQLEPRGPMDIPWAEANVTDEDMEAFISTPRAPIQHLSLGGCRLANASLPSMLGHALRLVSLDLSQCTRLHSIAFRELATCCFLKHLNLTDTKVDDFSLMAITNGVGRRLKTLNLTRCSRLSSYSTISHCTSLTALSLNLCPNVKDWDLQCIAGGCRELESLGLQRADVTATGLAWLANCSRLRMLELAFCLHVGVEGLHQVFRTCPWLRDASLPLDSLQRPEIFEIQQRGINVSFGTPVRDTWRH